MVLGFMNGSYIVNDTMESYHTPRHSPAMLFLMPTRAAPRSREFGDRLRRLRKARDLTQQQLADAIGCTQRAMVYYEKEGKVPPAATATKMAAYFGISVEELLESADVPDLKKPGAAPDLLNDPEERRLWRKFRQLRELPERQQQRILGMISDLVS